MTPQKLRELVTPPRFLLFTYVCGAAIGFVQGLITARLLGPAGYGFVGIFVTMGSLAANLWDVRLTDLATKLHFRASGERPTQTENLRLLLLLNSLLAFLMVISTALIGFLLWPWFTETKPEAHWLVIQGGVIGLMFLAGTAQAMQRLTDSFYTFALGKLGSQVAGTLIILAFLLHNPGIEAYYRGIFLSSVFGLVLAVVMLHGLWKKAFHHPLLAAANWLAAWPRYRAELPFVLSANIISYSKMLSRGGDILVFSLFSGDSATGVYRLARSLADNLNVFVDAVNQYYTPKFMEMLSHKKHQEFTTISRKFFMAAVAVTLLAVPSALVFLHLVNHHILLGRYEGLGLTTALLTANFIWIAGVSPWLWTAIIHHDAAHRMAATATTGALVQLATIALLSWLIAPRPELAALGAIAYYLVCFPPLLLWWKRLPCPT